MGGGRVSGGPIITDYTMVMCLKGVWGDMRRSKYQIRLLMEGVSVVPLITLRRFTKLTAIGPIWVKSGCRALIFLRQTHVATNGPHGFRMCQARGKESETGTE